MDGHDPLTVHVKMLRLELLNVKTALERELGALVLPCVWQRRWGAAVILHQTQRNKWDEQTGVEALPPPLYRQGLKRFPRRQGGLDALGFVTKFTKELTEYPDSATKDLLMADWQAEWNMAKILAVGRRAIGRPIADATLPPYLATRQHEMEFEEALP